MRWLDSITDSMDMNRSKRQKDRGTWQAVSMGSQRVGHDLATERQTYFKLPALQTAGNVSILYHIK